MQYKAHIDYSIQNDSRRLAIIARFPDGGRAIVQPLVFKSYQRNEYIPDTEAYCLGEEMTAEENVRPFLQAIMDAAWDIGIRPTQAKDQRDELKAVRYHLEDMRAPAFDKSKPTP